MSGNELARRDLLSTAITAAAVVGVAGVGASLWTRKDMSARLFNRTRLDHFSLEGVPDLIGANGAPTPGLSSADLRGRVSILNLWASWCPTCREEHAFVRQLAERGGAPVFGAAVKDEPARIRDFLKQSGNPYAAVGLDRRAHLQHALGAHGVPATFVIGPNASVLAAILGPLDSETIAQRILPALTPPASAS